MSLECQTAFVIIFTKKVDIEAGFVKSLFEGTPETKKEKFWSNFYA